MDSEQLMNIYKWFTWNVIAIMLAIAFYSMTAQAFSTSNIIAYYSFDDNSTTKIKDSSTNGFNGTNTGGVVDTGYLGSGFLFKTTTNNINVSGTIILDGDDSVCFWIKNSVNTARLVGGIGRIWDNGHNQMSTINLTTTSTQFTIRVGVNATTADMPTLGASYANVGTYYHFCIVKRRINTTQTNVTWYLNGTNLGTNLINKLNGNTTNNLYIGNRAALDRALNGTMDELMFYNGILSDSEVSVLYTNYTNGKSPYYTEPAADTCTYSGSGNWAITCSDNCLLSTATNLAGNNITITGTGTITISALINNWKQTMWTTTCRLNWLTGGRLG